MGMLKPLLIDRHNKWDENDSRGGTSQQTPHRTPKAVANVQDLERRQSSPSPRRRASMNTPQRDGRQIWYPDPNVAASATAEKRRVEVNPQAVQLANIQAERRAREQAGILQRQREAEEDARAARLAAMYDAPSSSSQPVSMPIPASILPQRASAQPASRTVSGIELPIPPLLPLENPNRHDGDSTDGDLDEVNDEELYRKIADLSMNSSSSRASTSTLTPFGGYVVYHITQITSHPLL